MQPSSDAIALVKASEGLRLQAYRDSGGRLTIGWGHTAGVYEGQTITEAEAETFLEDDLDEAAETVTSLVRVPLTQGQFDALVDFVFQFGAGRFMGSTLLRLLNRGLYDAACAQFKFWVNVDGVPEAGLIKRQAANAALFNARATSLANVTGSVE